VDKTRCCRDGRDGLTSDLQRLYKRCHVTTQRPTLKLAHDVPEPPAITAEVRAKLVVEAKEWRAGVAKQSAAIEAVTSTDLNVRAR